MKNLIFALIKERTVRSLIFTLILVASLVSCANLKEVRNFGGESAKLSAYTELTNRFRDTYQREQPYLFGNSAQLALENDKKRKEAYQDLIKIHECVSMYMKTLAKLAGDDTFDLSKGIDSIAGSIRDYPDFGIEAKHVDAYLKVTKVISKWITSTYQQRAIQEMVKDGNKPLQEMLEGMMNIVHYYKKTHENEKKSVLNFFEVELSFPENQKNRLLSVLARAHAQSKKYEYQIAEAKYAEAEKGVKSIAEGHKKLLENVEKLSNQEVRNLINQFAEDIKTVRENLQIIQHQT